MKKRLKKSQVNGETLVILDLDGTLGYSLIPEEEAFRKIFELTCKRLNKYCDLEISADEMEQFYKDAKKTHYELHFLKPKRHNKRLRLKIFLDKVQENNGVVFDSDFLDEIYNVYWDYFMAHAKSYPDTCKTLERLMKKSIVVIATNNEDDEAEIKRRLFGLEAGKHYRYLFTSDRLGVCKPAPEFLEELIGCLEKDLGESISNKRIIVVGDDPRVDFAWAKPIGATTIRVRKDLNAKREPSNEGEKPDFTVDNVSDILDLI
ncbi:MAG: HAD family hydrolase [Candidatus Jordarchaeum sp.]|uniref:HAD family hydrolase n=1 Tax=Candidatus Jordarchaeum sp. TaxID=2823881 RepID=UPI00404A1278